MLRKPKRLPTVLTEEEALKVIGFLSGTNKLMAKLLYGSDLRGRQNNHDLPAPRRRGSA